MPIIHPDDPIRLLISIPAATIEPNTSLSELAGKLERECVGALAVMEGDRLEGVVSERDVVRAVAARVDPSDLWTADLMAAEPVSVDLDEPIAIAAELMLEEGVRHLPVTDGGELVGVVSIRDVLRVYVDDWRRAAS
jgi:CBS domain-containing protein